MKSVAIELLKVEVVKVDPKTKLVDLMLDYSVNEKEKKALIRTKIEDCEETAVKVLKYLRNKEDNKTESDDLIDSILILTINNQEQVEEKLSHFFGRVLDKISEVASKRSADNFLNMYSGLSGQKIEFSKE